MNDEGHLQRLERQRVVDQVAVVREAGVLGRCEEVVVEQAQREAPDERPCDEGDEQDECRQDQEVRGQGLTPLPRERAPAGPLLPQRALQRESFDRHLCGSVREGPPADP